MQSLNKDANVFVKNVQVENLKELEELMRRFGNVLSCKITNNDYGYVQFEKAEEAQKAIKAINNTEQWGRVINLSIFKSQVEREELEKTGLIIKGFEKVLQNDEMRKFIEEQLKDVSSDL